MIQIYFFGGYLSSQSDVDMWRSSAYSQNPLLNITAYPWPQGASSEDPLKTFKGSLQIAREIVKVNGPVYIVGHSSGCAIANEVAWLTRYLDSKCNFSLICLDGFRPTRILFLLPKTQCWSAHSQDNLNEYWSLNYKVLSESNPSFHVYEAKVIEQWPLHFSLVNENVTNNTTIETGYKNCKANLMFLTTPDK